uniref:EOG090X07PD n=1 Tax=Daphnia sinensis TaxID=1820382 RepID=A0A4Y7NCG3_9CRUS|nr:EOG090X07PD [Daphnia sinensis]
MTDDKYKMMGNIPADISVVRFATVRAQEIVALTKMIENPQTTKLIFQKLPCHMRRRAMSHNPNRMPRLLREAHKSQMAKSGPALKPKRPRRKYRRRPSRLLEEYKKRSSKISWLETHLWHAKRFHMTVKWGYRLPEKSCARGHRFCYRSVAEHCLLMDTSYLCCIEIQGPQEAIVHGLAPLCDPNTGPTFGASSFLNGTREGRVMVFQRNSFLRGPIGLVTFLWRHGETPDLRTLWIWCHPAFYEQFLVELNSTYGSDSDSLIEHTNIKITLNKGKLNRLRLRGPFSHSVLSNLLDKDIRKVFVASQSPGFVTGVDVRDPRMILPQSRVKEHTSMPTQCETVLTSRSRLWDASVRDQISQIRTSFPDYIVNSRRSQLLVPGSELPLQPEEIPIPLLIVNASHESSDFVPGCDVIFPAGWATAFWLALIYSGGHAGGLKDVESMNFEYRICRDLCLEVDSDAGKTAAAEQKVKLMEDYFRRPPKTRTNFIKLATPFPFSVDWNRLLMDWDYQVEQGFTVLRDKKLLNTLSLKKQNLLSEFTFSHPHLVSISSSLVLVRNPGTTLLVKDNKGIYFPTPPRKNPFGKRLSNQGLDSGIALEALVPFSKSTQIRRCAGEISDSTSPLTACSSNQYKMKLNDNCNTILCGVSCQDNRQISLFLRTSRFSATEFVLRSYYLLSLFIYFVTQTCGCDEMDILIDLTFRLTYFNNTHVASFHLPTNVVFGINFFMSRRPDDLDHRRTVAFNWKLLTSAGQKKFKAFKPF